MTVRAPDWGPITKVQQKRMDEGEAQLEQIRAAAAYRAIFEEDTNATNCARCARLCDFRAERQGGFCRALRRMVATWHGASCQLFKAEA